MAFKDLLARFEEFESAFEDEPEATRDTEAHVRMQLANALAEVRRMLKALAADEKLERK